MDKVKRKQRKEHPGVRKILPPVLLLLALAVGAIGWFSRQETQKVSVPEKILTAGTIEQRETGSVYSIDVHLASGEGWYAEQTSAGNLTEKDGFDIEPALARNFLSAAAVIGYEDIFTEDPADYSDRLEEFGLAKAAVCAFCLRCRGMEASQEQSASGAAAQSADRTDGPAGDALRRLDGRMGA